MTIWMLLVDTKVVVFTHKLLMKKPNVIHAYLNNLQFEDEKKKRSEIKIIVPVLSTKCLHSAAT